MQWWIGLIMSAPVLAFVGFIGTALWKMHGKVTAMKMAQEGLARRLADEIRERDKRCAVQHEVIQEISSDVKIVGKQVAEIHGWLAAKNGFKTDGR